MTVAGVLDWRLRLYRGAWVAASPLLSAWLKTRARGSSSAIHNQRFALYPPLSTVCVHRSFARASIHTAGYRVETCHRSKLKRVCM